MLHSVALWTFCLQRKSKENEINVKIKSGSIFILFFMQEIQMTIRIEKLKNRILFCLFLEFLNQFVMELCWGWEPQQVHLR